VLTEAHNRGGHDTGRNEALLKSQSATKDRHEALSLQVMVIAARRRDRHEALSLQGEQAARNVLRPHIV
jgi:hypothetical protein